jgi:nucleoside phosphorylase
LAEPIQNVKTLKILILAALPQEYAPLRRLIPSWRLICRRPFKQFIFGLPGKEIRLVETGMGIGASKEALQWALSLSRPDILIFAGFCGGLHADLKVGDVCIVERAVGVHQDGKAARGIFRFRFCDEFTEWLAERSIKSISAVTIGSPVDKTVLAKFAATLLGCTRTVIPEGAELNRSANDVRRVKDGISITPLDSRQNLEKLDSGFRRNDEQKHRHDLIFHSSAVSSESSAAMPGGGNDCGFAAVLAGVDMETHVIAEIACREGLPFLCLRSVSDELDSELGFDLSDITGPGGKVKIGKVLKTIIRNPGTLKAFFLAWRRSDTAGKNLCANLADLLTTQGDRLSRISREVRIDCD